MTFFEQYLKAVDKCYVESLNDPETEPFKSKYEARKLFEDLRAMNIDEDSTLIRKELNSLQLIIEENEQFKFVSIQSDQPSDESSGNSSQKFISFLTRSFQFPKSTGISSNWCSTITLPRSTSTPKNERTANLSFAASKLPSATSSLTRYSPPWRSTFSIN